MATNFERFQTLNEILLKRFEISKKQGTVLTAPQLTANYDKFVENFIALLKTIQVECTKEDIDDGSVVHKIMNDPLVKARFYKAVPNYESFIRSVYPPVKVVYNNRQKAGPIQLQNNLYFTIFALHDGTEYKRRLTLKLVGFKNLWNVKNKDEREKNLMVRGSMLDLPFDINQDSESAKQGIVAIRAIERTMAVSYELFYDDLFKDYLQAMKGKRVKRFSVSKGLLIKHADVEKTDRETKEVAVESFELFRPKFIGDYENNYMKTLVIDLEKNPNASRGKRVADDEDYNFHNLRNALPKQSTIAMYVDMSTAYVVIARETVYMANELLEVLVVRNKDNLYTTDANKVSDIDYINSIRSEMGLPQLYNLDNSDKKTEVADGDEVDESDAKYVAEAVANSVLADTTNADARVYNKKFALDDDDADQEV
jgi:hypothetical protein